MEGLGKKLKEARLARNLTLDEAGRLTKIRPGRLEEIENEDFSQFASLAYAKGFLLIYGKFLDVDVTPYMEAFETSEHVTVDGYSYLQEEPAPTPVRAPVVRRRPNRPTAPTSTSSDRPSLMPLVIGIVVIGVGFWIGKLFVNLRRLTPPPTAQSSPSPQTPAPNASKAPSVARSSSPPATSFATTARVAESTPAPALTPAP